jgi:hypothetical protein
MSTEPRANLRVMGAFAGCALIVAAIFWWAPWDKPDVPANASLTASKLVEEDATSMRTNVLEPALPQDEEDSSSNRVTAEEIRKVQNKLSAARKLLHDIEASHVKPVLVSDNPGWRNEHVYLPALTREQLDPVYTQLSDAGREFPVGSAGAKMFRQEADKFLANLAKLPAKHATRKLEKKTRQTSYALTLLSEDSTVTKGEGDSLEILGTAISSNQFAKPDEVGYLFPDEPK